MSYSSIPADSGSSLMLLALHKGKRSEKITIERNSECSSDKSVKKNRSKPHYVAALYGVHSMVSIRVSPTPYSGPTLPDDSIPVFTQLKKLFRNFLIQTNKI